MQTLTSPTRASSSRGYLASTVGGLTGSLLAGGGGVAVGLAIATALEDPSGGMENLWLIIFPLGLGALGLVVGMWAGILVALQRTGHDRAMATAAAGAALTVVAIALLPAMGVGALGLLVAPVLARYVTVDAAGSATPRS